MLTSGRPEPATPPAGLRLRAEDAEDIGVISACLQDALVSVRDLFYDRDVQRFMLVANRFRWEGCGAPSRRGDFERILCALTFDAVENVAYRGFHRRDEDRILSLLAIRTGPGPAGATVDLEFADGATIRMSAAAISCRARDFGEPWPTRWLPGHELDGPP